MKTEVPKCPFCGFQRESGFVCEKCGANLIWMIPWAEGGAALPLEDKKKRAGSESGVPAREEQS